LGVKRGLDIALALAGLLLVAPVLLVISALVRWSSPGPAFFRQSRIGAGGRGFEILKFRTMVQDAEDILHDDPELKQLYLTNNFKIPAESDPRVTGFGSFLRRTSLDELPQLFNVLRGDMSLVGARPIEASQVHALYGSRQALYLAMRPGLTGHWQVSGRSTIGDDDRAALDIHYLRNWSLRLDVMIMLKTLPAVLRRHGAY
jgi:exopolysaccharide production protein ExoY